LKIKDVFMGINNSKCKLRNLFSPGLTPVSVLFDHAQTDSPNPLKVQGSAF
jgi:hypothetical protein